MPGSRGWRLPPRQRGDGRGAICCVGVGCHRLVPTPTGLAHAIRVTVMHPRPPSIFRLGATGMIPGPRRRGSPSPRTPPPIANAGAKGTACPGLAAIPRRKTPGCRCPCAGWGSPVPSEREGAGVWGRGGVSAKVFLFSAPTGPCGAAALCSFHPGPLPRGEREGRNALLVGTAGNDSRNNFRANFLATLHLSRGFEAI